MWLSNGVEHLVGGGAVGDAVGFSAPEDGTVAIDEHLGRYGDITAEGAAVLMQQAVAANHIGRWIGQDGKGQFVFLNDGARAAGRVDPDGNGLDAGVGELLVNGSDPAKLRDAGQSPVSACEDQQHAACRAQVTQGDVAVVLVG